MPEQHGTGMNRDPKIQALIEDIVERLVAEYAPQKIILFGSYAYGEPDEESDVDLLIIKETPERFLDRIWSARRIAAGALQEVPLELLVLTPQEVRMRVAGGDQVIAEILEKGEVLYAAWGISLSGRLGPNRGERPRARGAGSPRPGPRVRRILPATGGGKVPESFPR